MSKLTDDLAALPERGAPTNGCALTEAFAANPEDKEAIIAAVRNLRYSSAAVSEALTKNGIKIGDAGVRRHRANRCTSCTREGVSYK